MTPIREQLARLLGSGDDGPRDAGGKMIVAMHEGGKHVYAGTVLQAEKQRRRAANRFARRSRRINRMRGAA